MKAVTTPVEDVVDNVLIYVVAIMGAPYEMVMIPAMPAEWYPVATGIPRHCAFE